MQKGIVMGWYNSFKKATKGVKKMTVDLGRVLSGSETKKALENIDTAVDIGNKITGGPEASAAINASKGIKKSKSKSKKN